MRADGSGLVAKRDCVTNVRRDGGLGVNQHPLDMGYGRADVLLDALCGCLGRCRGDGHPVMLG